jgi:hypothetical protein
MIVQLHPFLTSALHRDEWSDSRRTNLKPGERFLLIRRMRKLDGHQSPSGFSEEQDTFLDPDGKET